MAYDKTTDLLDIQADVLTSDTSTNTKIKKLKQLKTSDKTITGAINYLNTQLTNANDSIVRAIERIVVLEDEIAACKALLQLATDDYEDVFSVSAGEPQTEFVLTHKPIGKIRMYVGGTRQFKSMFTYNPDTNTVTWVADAQSGGFDLEDTEVVFEYDYDTEEEQ